MSDYPEKLRKLNPWIQMDWPETCRASADHIEAQENLIQEMREAYEYYELALSTREHGVVAMSRLASSISSLLSKAKSQQEGETE